MPTSKGGCLLYAILIVVLVVVAFCGGPNLLDDVTGIGGGDSSGYSASNVDDAQDTGRYDHCETGEDANNDPDCARVAIENSLNDYWEGELGGKFHPEKALITFDGSVSTGCGPADSSVGPFYCPVDETIYYDTSFYDEVLEQQLGGPDGGFVEAYVLAHEFGHHIQNLLGAMSRPNFSQQGPNSDSVRLELQADCYAGMWAHGATTTEDASGEVLIEDLTQEDIDLAIQAAESVGDDRIQKKTQGQVDEETWTHGSAEERENWFMVGYRFDDLGKCDLWAVKDVDDWPTS